MGFDDFTQAFASYMESGQVEQLADFCDPNAELEIFEIYRNGYFRATIEALVSNYPAVVALVGDAFFRTMAKRYVMQFPPLKGSLVGYGANFVSFLKDSDTSQTLPYLTDIARMDDAWLKVYFSADTLPLGAESMQSLIEEAGDAYAQHLLLNTAAALLSLDYPVISIWQALKEQGELSDAVELNKSSDHALIWRFGAEMLIRQLPEAEYIFLSNLHAGLGVEAAADRAIQSDSGFDLGLFFSNLISAGLLTTNFVSDHEEQQDKGHANLR